MVLRSFRGQVGDGEGRSWPPGDLIEYEYAIGDFFGETPILLGTQALVSLRAETSCRVVRLERQEFQILIRDSKEASAMILQTMNDRLMRVQKYATGATVVASAHSG